MLYAGSTLRGSSQQLGRDLGGWPPQQWSLSQAKAERVCLWDFTVALHLVLSWGPGHPTAGVSAEECEIASLTGPRGDVSSTTGETSTLERGAAFLP